MTTTATTDVKTMGRPRKNAGDEPFYASALYKMLLRRLPEFKDSRGRLDTLRLAASVGYARFTVYNWMYRNRLTPRAAKALIDLGDGRITRKDVNKFLMPES